MERNNTTHTYTHTHTITVFFFPQKWKWCFLLLQPLNINFLHAFLLLSDALKTWKTTQERRSNTEKNGPKGGPIQCFAAAPPPPLPKAVPIPSIQTLLRGWLPNGLIFCQICVPCCLNYAKNHLGRFITPKINFPLVG